MDIDVAYTKLAELFSEWEDVRGDGSAFPSGLVDMMDEARDAWQNLDGWLRAGGFAPRVWDPARP